MQNLASQSSYSENDSRLPTRELKQIQRNTDYIKYTGDRFTETKDHNSRNADGELSTKRRALPLGSLNDKNKIEHKTAFQHSDAVSELAIADAQAIQLLLDNGF